MLTLIYYSKIMKQLKVKKLDPNAKLPIRAHVNDAGIDLFALETCELLPHQPTKIKTGIAMAIDNRFCGMICDRSSLGSKGIKTLGGIIDSGYRGEIIVVLINLTTTPYKIEKHDKIAQLLILPIQLCVVSETSELNSTSRNTQGFGSTGR
jgi:dUTP pyrophosphatase